MRKIKSLLPYIGVGIVSGLILLVVPMIIRGFFNLLLLLMKNPAEALVLILVATISYSIGVYLGERNL